MNDDKVDEIKKEDKKAFRGFIVILSLCVIIGAICGAMSATLGEVFGDNLSNFFISILSNISPYASIILSVVVMIVSQIIYTKSRKEYEVWKQREEDDDTIDKIEKNISYLILMVAVNMILGYFFFGAGSNLRIFNNSNEVFDITKVLLLFIGIIFCTSSSILIQNKLVNFEKEINPLLKGSIYDSRFTKKWVDSCDESIKLSIYKSAYKSYSSTSATCSILWLFCIVGSDLWNFGIMPLVMVTIIWLVSTISYCIEAIKQSNVK